MQSKAAPLLLVAGLLSASFLCAESTPSKALLVLSKATTRCQSSILPA